MVHSQVSWAGTPLQDLAATMKPGTWMELATNNINPTLSNTGGSSNFIFGYTESINWDPISRKLFYAGMDHNQPEHIRFVSYDEATNSWQKLTQPAAMACPSGSACTPSHGYDHHAIDPANRYYYFRYSYNGRVVHRYHIDTQTWTRLTDNNVLNYNQCCGGVDYFPELGGLVWVQGGEFSTGNGGISHYSYATSNWSRIGASTGYPMGNKDNFAEYNPIHKVLVFGGGGTRLYKLSAGGVVTALQNAPFVLGIQNSIFTVDPVSGDYLVLNNARQFWKYSVTTDSWSQLAAPPSGVWNTNSGVHGMVAGPLSTYGVTTVVTCRDSSGTNCTMYLYKHGGSPTTTVADTTAPSVPTTLVASAASSNQINLSWTPSTDNVAVAGYQVFRGASQIGTTTSPSYQDSGLSASTLYTYSITAYDGAGNYSAKSANASATTTAGSTTTTPPGASTFTQKCAQAGVINCFTFDDPSKLYYAWPTGTVCDAAFAGKTRYSFGNDRIGLGNTAATVQNGQCVFPQIDTTLTKSGAGSLKFTIPSNSGANSSGFFTEPFKRNANGTFPYIAPGSPLGNVVYMQFYQRFSTEFLTTKYAPGGGWKQIIWYGNPPKGSSASSIEVAHNNGYLRGVPTMYGQIGQDDYGIQDVRGCYYNFNGLRTYPEPPCIRFKPDQWMEFTVRIEVIGSPNAPTSRVQMWVDGQLAIDYQKAKINWGSPDGDGIGQFQITPYQTAKDATQVHPVGYTWVDDVIISTQPIAMGSSTPPITVSTAPNAPSSLQLTIPQQP